MFAQRTYPDGLEVAPEHIDDHGQLINPEFAHKLTHAGYPEIVSKLTPFVELVALIDIGLQVLRIGIHGTKLIHVNGLAVFAGAGHLENRSIGSMGVESRCFDFARHKIEQVADGLFMHHFKTTRIEPAQHLSPADDAVMSIG